MRKMLLVLVLVTAGIFRIHAADTPSLTTNTISLGSQGSLLLPTPRNWTFARTNMPTARNAPSFELHSADNTIAIRLTVYWDGYGEKGGKLSPAEMDTIVSKVATRQYVPISVEQTFTLEKLQGAQVSGTFARFTDAAWTPLLKDQYRNLATGMFRCGNMWGNFDLLCGDKDGPTFKAGLSLLESMRHDP